MATIPELEKLEAKYDKKAKVRAETLQQMTMALDSSRTKPERKAARAAKKEAQAALDAVTSHLEDVRRRLEEAKNVRSCGPAVLRPTS